VTKEAPGIFQFIRHETYIERVRRYARPGARILDVGCGSGLVSLTLADAGYDVVACDVSRAMLEVLEREKGSRKVETRHGDAYALPAADREFDVVISRMFIQHFVDWPRIVAEKSRVTKPGGYVIFDFGNREHFEACGLDKRNDCGFPYEIDPGNSQTFYVLATEDEMKAVAASAGLSVVEISPIGFLLYNGFIWKALGEQGARDFDRKLDNVLHRDGAKELMALIENAVLPLLPKSVAYGNITVLRK
jgi:2-polyprenyl-3-methyl-5-hydroxy-6-metoxy-1,4-benzoquinol methylase